MASWLVVVEKMIITISTFSLIYGLMLWCVSLPPFSRFVLAVLTVGAYYLTGVILLLLL